MIIIPIKWLFHWEYTQHFQTNPNDEIVFGTDQSPISSNGFVSKIRYVIPSHGWQNMAKLYSLVFRAFGQMQ